MQGFPDSAEQFEQERKSAISADSRKVFEAISENAAVKAVLVELRHTCYHGVADYGPGFEPITFGHVEKFYEVKGDAQRIFDVLKPAPEGPLPIAVRIFDAMGALVWSKERDANA